MARMSKANEYAINWLNSQGKNIEQISQELGLNTKQVQKFLEKTNTLNSSNTIETKNAPVKIKSSDLMIRHTAAKKNNSVAIMTKEASEMNDASKKSNSGNPNIQKNIFRPNG